MSARLFWNALLAAPAAAVLALAAHGAPQPGQRLPREIAAAAEPFASVLRQALRDRDEPKVRAAVAGIISAYGAWAGVPDAAETYGRPVARGVPPLEALIACVGRPVDPTDPRLPWIRNPDGNPARMNSGLRTVGDPVSGWARLGGLFPSDRARYAALARAGADYLLKVQGPGGGFPFPDLRGRNGQFGPMIEHLVRAHPEAVRDGWLVDDGGGGDLKYDTAICGVALLDAWRLTADSRYLEASVRAARWAAGRALVANWNYNAFSAWLLGEVARETGDPALLEAAVDHAFIGVLPGQLPNGRWFDQHNARIVYHCIIVRGLIATWRAMPASHPRRDELRRAIELSLANACDEIRSKGAPAHTTPPEAIGLALETLGRNPAWAEAAHITVNAALASAGSGRRQLPATHLLNYLEWRLSGAGSSP